MLSLYEEELSDAFKQDRSVTHRLPSVSMPQVNYRYMDRPLHSRYNYLTLNLHCSSIACNKIIWDIQQSSLRIKTGKKSATFSEWQP